MKVFFAYYRPILAYVTFSLYTFQNFGVLNSYLIHESPLISQYYYWGSTATNILVLMLCGILGNRVARFFEKPHTAIFAGLLCSFGTLFSGLISSADNAFLWAFLFSILATGAGTGLLYFELAGKFLRINSEGIIKAALATYFISLVLNAFLSLLSGAISLIITAVLPCITAFLLIDDARESALSQIKQSRTENRQLAPLIVRLGICVVVFSLISGVTKGLYMESNSSWDITLTIAMILAAFASFGLVALSALFSKRFDAVALYRTVFFIAIVCVSVLLVSLGNISIAFPVQRVAGDLFRILIFVFSLKLCLRTAYNPLLILGSTLALSKVASFVVSLALNQIPGLHITSDSALTAVGLALIVLTAFLYLFLFTEDDVQLLMETSHVMTTKEANEIPLRRAGHQGQAQRSRKGRAAPVQSGKDAQGHFGRALPLRKHREHVPEEAVREARCA